MCVDIDAAGCMNTRRHCSVGGHAPQNGFYSADELRSLKKEWGPLTIRFELTAHPNFPEIFQPDIATDHGGWLVTNGFGLAHRYYHEAFFEELSDSGVETIAFTLYGLRDHHDWFVIRAGAFDYILAVTRRAKAHGFSINWQIYVDKAGISDVPGLIELAVHETGDIPTLAIPYHRVGGRLWHYETLRVSLSDIKKYRFHELDRDPNKNLLLHPEEYTSSVWLRKWKENPTLGEFQHPYEPLSWPPDVDYQQLSLQIDCKRKVYLDPMCNLPIYLGRADEGKQAILEEVKTLPAPDLVDLDPGRIHLSSEEQDQLHPCGFSLRYKEISKARQSKPGD